MGAMTGMGRVPGHGAQISEWKITSREPERHVPNRLDDLAVAARVIRDWPPIERLRVE